MDKKKLSLIIQEKKHELTKIENKLFYLIRLSERVSNNATGLQVLDFIDRNPEIPQLIIRDIDLKQVAYNRINESTTIPSQLFRSRLKEFIDVYLGSKKYLEIKIKELSSFLKKNE
ncbi:MAG: hypothetical protein EU539_12295 [Promethearchaeota archaeon]|nr:MAG: hypothetical protein EU539_12295 [Candidatus Lokiarchaeota archaeon]